MIIQRMKSTNKNRYANPKQQFYSKFHFIKNSIHNSYQIRKSILFQMYNFSSVSFKMPSKWTFHQNSSLQHIIWNVMSYLRQLRHEMIVLLNWLIAVEKFGTFKKTFVEHYSLCLVILIVQTMKNTMTMMMMNDTTCCIIYSLPM